jgi:hypothetical protein
MSLTIGITVNLEANIFSNGINQNGIYLANLLNKLGYTTYLIYAKNPGSDPIKEVRDIKVITFEDAFNVNFSIIIQLGITISQINFNKFKHKNKDVKLVSYKCGNDFVIDMESIFFNAHEKRTETLVTSNKDLDLKPDQIWSIPQNANANLQYFSFMTGQDNATPVPFIWDPMALDSECEDHGYQPYTKRDLTKIAVMEPNLGVTKNILLPLAILERQYKNHANFDKVYLIGAEKLKSNKRLIQILAHTEIHKNKLVTAEPRIPTLDVLNKHMDVVLSWQWENNLNYLWIDVAWMGWPVVHNGSMCQDIGYYYPGFDISKGQESLQKVLTSHNLDVDYLERNRKAIKRYTIDNPQLLKDYEMLINNLLNNTFKKYNYNWETNSISYEN